MNKPTGDAEFEVELEVEIEAELTMSESSRPEESAELPASKWLFDPTDVQREEIELRNLLSAVEGLQGDSRSGRRGTGEGA